VAERKKKKTAIKKPAVKKAVIRKAVKKKTPKPKKQPAKKTPRRNNGRRKNNGRRNVADISGREADEVLAAIAGGPPSKKSNAGRKRLVFDAETVGGLRRIGCKDEEIASFFRVSVDTLARRKVDDAEFKEAYDRGHGEWCVSLRASIARLALRDDYRSTGLKIFLAKNFLGMSDRQEFLHGALDPAPALLVGSDEEAEEILRRVSPLFERRQLEAAESLDALPVEFEEVEVVNVQSKPKNKNRPDE